MNRVGNNLCSFGEEMGDICHLYLNPDKDNIKDMFLTMHLMERMKQREDVPNYANVTIRYVSNSDQKNWTAQANLVEYEYFEERDQRTIFRAHIRDLLPNVSY